MLHQEFRILDQEEMSKHMIRDRIGYVPLPCRSMVIWRSDVVHCSYGGDEECFEGKDEGDFARLMQLCCMCPRNARPTQVEDLKLSFWDSKVQRQEKEAGDEKKTKRPKPGACSTHYPHVCVWNGCGPGHYSNPREGARHWDTHKPPLLPLQKKFL